MKTEEMTAEEIVTEKMGMEETKEKFSAEDTIKRVYTGFSELESFAKVMLNSAQNENDITESADLINSLHILCDKFESVKGEFDIYLKKLY